MAYLLGLTGNIACGKTTIGQMLLALGAASYIDADAVVHDLYEPGQSVHAAIIQHFGPLVVTATGTIDRAALGAIVFADPERLRLLESLTHPGVNVAIAERLAQVPVDKVAVIDAVKLLEGGMGRLCNAVWLVTCDPTEQRRRLIEERHMTAAEADARLAAQPDNAQRRALVSTVIDNSGTRDATRQQIDTAWARFMASVTTTR